ncbi:MAG TPA: hypothetical protein VJ692_02045, partial [Nitrospiraceae bacterium]|nr:hypothetical protein [Nitrospiraceae bacterium]
VRLSAHTLLHFIAVRAEKRFRSVWEQCVPDALGAILLITPESVGNLSHLQTFLKAKDSLEPTLPVHAFLPNHATAIALPGLHPSDLSFGSMDDQTVRLTVLDRILLQWLNQHPAQANAGR